MTSVAYETEALPQEQPKPEPRAMNMEIKARVEAFHQGARPVGRLEEALKGKGGTEAFFMISNDYYEQEDALRDVLENELGVNLVLEFDSYGEELREDHVNAWLDNPEAALAGWRLKEEFKQQQQPLRQDAEIISLIAAQERIAQEQTGAEVTFDP